jgi:transposase
LSTKINALVDENGLPVRLMVTAGQAHDLQAAPALIAELKCRHVVADRGYDSDGFLAAIRASGAKAHIPTPSRRVIQRTVSRRIYRQRNLVERYFCKLKHFRRVATRFDKLARNYLASVMLASTRIWLRTYESTT